MPHAVVNDQRIYFEDTGGDGPAVVLAHGFLMDHEMFAPQVAALREAYRVITWDERGFGQTQYDGQPFDYWDSAADCLGLLDHLGIERAVVSATRREMKPPWLMPPKGWSISGFPWGPSMTSPMRSRG